jgi:DNA polymerase
VTPPCLNLDFETRSTVNLKKTGVHRYATDPSTDVWCLAFMFDNHTEPRLWVPGDPVPPEVQVAFASGVELRAWNAAFERIIWRDLFVPRFGFPKVPDDQWVCTMVEAAALGLPMGLGPAAQVLGLGDDGKDADGHKLMMQMAKPRRPRKGEDPDGVYWFDDEDRRQRLYEYCRQDVRVERAIAAKLRRLSDMEREVYLLDQRINDRGVYVDVPLVLAARDLVSVAMDFANEELAEVTGGAVTAVTNPAAITAWIQDTGLEIDNLRKDTVRDLLAGEDELEPDVEAVLQLRADAGKSSNAKLEAMLGAVDSDNRARGLYQYHGASTGRWSGRRIQSQNLPRPTVKNVEVYIPHVMRGEYDLIAMDEPVPVVVSSMLRSMLRAAPGNRLLAGDYGQIEARVLAWIAGQEDLLALFAAGGKVYEDMAAFIYTRAMEEIEEDSEERQVGKGAILGCGFQMGADRFEEQTRELTGIQLDRGEKRETCKECGTVTVRSGREKGRVGCCRNEDREIVWVREDVAEKAVNGYRFKNDRIKQFWSDINDAAIRAVAEPGTVQCVGRNDGIRYTHRGAYLWCRLPSGRFLAYAKPQLGQRRLPEPWDDVKKTAVSYLTVDGYSRKWRRVWTYGGHLTENVVQAMARDLMASAMLRLDKAGYPIVMHTHDEIVVEVPEGEGSMEEFLKLMKRRPKWAAGLPIKVGGWTGERYRK